MMLVERPFYFVRHGQTDWNLHHRAQGQTDIALNAEGRREAHRAAEAASGLAFMTICTSPLSRALETAQIIQRRAGGSIEIIDDLIECSWGEREGEVKQGWFQAWRQGIETPSGAEPFDAFIARAKTALNAALAKPGPVLIVAHGGIYWAVQIYATRNLDLAIPNAKIIQHQPPTIDHPWWETVIID